MLRLGRALSVALFCIALIGGAARAAVVVPPPSATFDAAVRAEHGEGVVQDYGLAHRLYCAAAAVGDPRAFAGLGWMYLNGRGVPRNDAIAAAWLRRAAEQGIPQAGNLLHLLADQSAPADLGCAPPKPPLVPIAAPAAIRAMVQHIAAKAGLEPDLVLAVIAAESAFNPQAVSAKNAQGLMQLLPETAVRFGVRNTFAAEDNIRGGATYLHWLLQRFSGNLDLALAAYNAGEGRVTQYGGVPPYDETLHYIDRVKRSYDGPGLRPR